MLHLALEDMNSFQNKFVIKDLLMYIDFWNSFKNAVLAKDHI